MKERKFTHFFLSLLSILVVYPFFEGRAAAGSIFVVIFSFILLFGVRVISGVSKIKTGISLSLALPAILLLWVNQFTEIRAIEIMFGSFMSAFSLFSVFCLLSHIFRAKKVDFDLLAGAASVYLLFGISWGMLYSLLDLLVPGSFNVPEALSQQTLSGWPVFNYYSFTTLTTTGYGDISPVTIYAQSLSILEAVTGVLFTACISTIPTVLFFIPVRVSRQQP